MPRFGANRRNHLQAEHLDVIHQSVKVPPKALRLLEPFILRRSVKRGEEAKKADTRSGQESQRLEHLHVIAWAAHSGEPHHSASKTLTPTRPVASVYPAGAVRFTDGDEAVAVIRSAHAGLARRRVRDGQVQHLAAREHARRRRVVLRLLHISNFFLN